jgi:YaiO family outer membrane protein
VAYADYANYLDSRRMKNEIGLAYLHTKILDSTHITINSVATVQYTRRFNKGQITGRVNYAGRYTSTGYQFEAEAYYNFTKKWHIFGVAAYSPDGFIFPTVRLGLSLGHTFNKGWEAEVGGRYLKADSGFSGGTITSLMASVGRDYKDYYFNLRGYLMNFVHVNNASNIYYSAVLTTRFYLDNRSAYFSGIAGYGTAPDDFSLNYQLTQIIYYNTVSVGGGYSKTLQHRTTIGIFGTWYNEKIGINDYRNQYDIYVILLRRF